MSQSQEKLPELTQPYPSDPAPMQSQQRAGPSMGMHVGNAIRTPLVKTFCFLSRNATKILLICLLAIGIWMLVYNTCYYDDSTNITFIDSALHYNCKHKGGCGASCPYLSSDDPRVMMKQKVESLEYAKSKIMEDIETDDAKLEIAISQVSPANAKSLNAALQPIMSHKKKLASSINNYLLLSQALFDKHGKEDKLSSDVLKASAQVSGYEALANLISIAYASVCYNQQTVVMLARVMNLPDIDQKKITSFDDVLNGLKISTNKIQTSAEEMVKYINGHDFNVNASYIQTSATSTDLMMGAVSTIINKVNEFAAMYQDNAAYYDNAKVTFGRCIKEGFNNALPATLNPADVSALIDDNDYSTALIKTALEPEIVSNHLKFASERSAFDSGGGVHSVRDDDNDLVPWVGLFGRPTYRKSDGSSIEKSNEPLRSIPSTNPEDMMRTKTPRITFA